jgi:hypothetical protein
MTKFYNLAKENQHEDSYHSKKGMTLSITPLSIMPVDAKCCYAENSVFIVVLNVTMLSVNYV